MNKKIIIVLLAFLLIPLVTAGEFSIQLEPHYYVQGKEVVWTPDIEVSAIAFEVVGINHNEKFRILNMTIIDAYPIAFKESLPDTTGYLRILQEKTLWVGKMINLDDIQYSNIDFWIGVEGTLENTEGVIYYEEHLNVTLIIPEDKEDFLSSFGNKIWEGSPIKGILFVVGGIAIGGFVVWRYKVSDKVDEWRERAEIRRKIKNDKLG